MNQPASIENRREFRDTLGTFATGVTVLTTLAADGQPIGVTIRMVREEF